MEIFKVAANHFPCLSPLLSPKGPGVRLNRVALEENWSLVISKALYVWDLHCGGLASHGESVGLSAQRASFLSFLVSAPLPLIENFGKVVSEAFVVGELRGI